MEAVLLQARLCGDSGLKSEVVLRQCSYKTVCVETVLLQDSLCGDSALTRQVV